MRLIRLIFWVAATVILAYFMTDFKIGGRTVKERIDTFLHSDEGGDLKGKARSMAERFIAATLGKDNVDKPLPTPPPEEIKSDDMKKLEELFKNQ